MRIILFSIIPPILFIVSTLIFVGIGVSHIEGIRYGENCRLSEFVKCDTFPVWQNFSLGLFFVLYLVAFLLTKKVNLSSIGFALLGVLTTVASYIFFTLFPVLPERYIYFRHVGWATLFAIYFIVPTVLVSAIIAKLTLFIINKFKKPNTSEV